MLQRPVRFILGQTGSGKSFLADQLQQREPRVLIAGCGFDEFRAEPAESWADLIRRLDERQAFGSRRPFRICYSPRPEEFGAFFELAVKLGHVHLVLEEGDRFSEAEYDEEGELVYAGKGDHWYKEAVTRGRHYALGFTMIALRHTAFPTLGKSQLTELVSFRQVLPDDVKWVRDVAGDLALELPTLPGPPSPPPHPYLRWTPTEGAVIVRPKSRVTSP